MMSTSTPQDNKKRIRKEKSTYFSEENLDDIMQPHEDSLVIQVGIGPNYRIERIIIDTGSSADILYLDTFTRMDLKREDLSHCKETICEFTNIAAPMAGVIEFKVFIGSKKKSVSQTYRFIYSGRS